MRIDESETYLDDETSLVFRDDEPFTGQVETKDENGDLLELMSFREGVTDGTQQVWYPGGQKMTEGTSRMGEAVGDWYEWHPNGVLAVHNAYDEEGRLLHVKRWDTEGDLVEDR
ncbi:MAG TPA: hypothetical protein VNO31_09255 [Umezawaea sp.]|nr:hypothetical protein [Umezawaea sp.]